MMESSPFQSKPQRLSHRPFHRWNCPEDIRRRSRPLGEPANETGFLTPWLYVYVGRPGRTVDRVRTILDKEFHLAPKGYSGDEDAGAMSSWCVFGAMGFFPNAGKDVYLLGTPLFRDVRPALSGGKAFRILAQGLSAEDRYVQPATLRSGAR